MPASISPEVRARVADALTHFLAEEREALGALSPEATHLVDVLERYLEGGKFLRPEFVAVGGLLGGAPVDRTGDLGGEEPCDLSTLATLGAAVELVQAAALMHDDVLDHSPTRRGRPSVHVAAEARHGELGLDGDGADFGVATAVVLGDLVLSMADRLASRALTGRDDRAQYEAMKSEVMAGQYLDILNQAGGMASASDPAEAALTVIRWKTVSYTVLRPLLLGAAHTSASPQVMEILERLAVPLGTAFQLRDDVLGVFGDESAIGKSASGDITEGKRTTMLAHALQNATPDQRVDLDRAVGKADASPADIAAAREVFAATGARRATEDQIAELDAQVRDIIDGELGPLCSDAAVSALESLRARTTGLPRN